MTMIIKASKPLLLLLNPPICSVRCAHNPMRLSVKLFFLSILFVHSIYAQQLLPGEWRTYTSMRSIRAMAVANDSVHLWSASNGGAFRLNLRDPNEPLFALRTTDGLFENDLTAVACDDQGNTFFGSASGGFDVLRSDGSVSKLEFDILKNSSLSSDKRINSLTMLGDSVLIGADFGFAVYRKTRGYFAASSQRVGTGPLQSDTVQQFAVLSNRIYAALPHGVAFATIGSDLPTPASWTI